MIHPIWSLSASHCFPGMEWSARSSQLHATLYALGRNSVAELTDYELQVLELNRSEAEELESERSEKDNGYSFQVQFQTLKFPIFIISDYLWSSRS